MRAFCPHCGSVQTVSVKTREETYTVRGEAVTVPHSVTICTACSQTYATSEQTQESLKRVREAYRSEHNLVGPEEIVRIRDGYGAGQKPFGLILGLGESTINSYENGELPTVANSNLIRTAADPAVFRRLFEDAQGAIGPTQRKRIASALEGRRTYRIPSFAELSVREDPGTYSGLRTPNLERILLLLRTILIRLGEPTVKTKLLKLAFLCDSEHFRRYTVSITGWPYARLPYGPVPQEYKELIVIAEKDGYVSTEDRDDGTTFLTATQSVKKTVEGDSFSEAETKTINEVIERFGGMTATELSDYTHTLPAWKQTSHAATIPFELVFRDSSDKTEGS